jgi:two-component system nitrogen regulation response regulator GlnG
MSSPALLLIAQDSSLIEGLRQEIPSDSVITLKSAKELGRRQSRRGFHLVLLELKRDWARELSRIRSIRRGNGCLLVGSAAVLKKSLGSVKELHRTLSNGDGQSEHPAHSRRTMRELCLSELLETRLKDFVRKMKETNAHNLYNLLLEEFERPVLALVLKETRGNQIQAAQLLGMNRNTLRKKIQTLKIPVKRSSRAL